MRHQRLVRAALLAWLGCASGLAHGKQVVTRRARASRRETGEPQLELADRVHHVVGTKLVFVDELLDGHSELFWGPGLIYELALIPHWLEIELAGAYLVHRDQAKVPLDVILKKPFHLSRVIDLFAGVGPMLSIAIHRDTTDVHVGVIASTGAFFWLRPGAGLLVEVDYAYVAEGGGAHELESACGLAIRFD